MAADTQDFSLKNIAVPVFGPSVLYGASNGAILPVVALSAVEQGASLALAGLITALVGIGSLVSNIPAGLLAARYGERMALMLAAAFSSLALLLCALTPSLIGLALGVFMVGMATAVFLLARQAYVADAVPSDRRALALSSLGGATRIGMFVGPFLGAGAIALVGLNGAYWVAMAAMAGAATIAYFSPDFSPPENKPVAGAKTSHTVTTRDILRDHWRVFATLGVGAMFVGAIRASRQIVLPLWAAHLGLSPAVISLIFGMVSAVDMSVFYPAGKIMDKYGRLWVVLPSTFLMGMALILLPLTSTPFTFICVALMLGFGNGIGSGIVMTLAADASPAKGRNVFLGVWRLIVDIGNSGGPALLATITALASLGTGIATIGFGGLLATAVFWRWHPRGKPPTSRRNTP